MKKGMLFSIMTFLIFSLALFTYANWATVRNNNNDFSKIAAIKNINYQFDSVVSNMKYLIDSIKFTSNNEGNSTKLTFSEILPKNNTYDELNSFLSFVNSTSRFSLYYEFESLYYILNPYNTTIKNTQDGVITENIDQISYFDIYIYAEGKVVSIVANDCESDEGVLLRIEAHGSRGTSKIYEKKLDPTCISDITIKYTKGNRVKIQFGNNKLSTKVLTDFEIIYKQTMEFPKGKINILTSPIYLKMFDSTLEISKEKEVMVNVWQN